MYSRRFPLCKTIARAKIVSTHGVRGEMKARPLCDGAQFLAKFKRLYAAANGSGEVALRGVRAQGNMLLIKLAGVEDMDAARAQVGKTYYFAKADAKLPEGRYFIDDLIGCTVLHADDGRTLGIVAKVDHPGVQDIYIVRDAAGGRALDPCRAGVCGGCGYCGPHSKNAPHCGHV